MRNPRFMRLTAAPAGLAAVIVSAAIPLAAGAADWKPNGPVRVIVSFAPGGATDILARALAEKMREPLGQPVIVESRPGAAGQVAIDALKAAAPDGRTLLLGSSTMTVSPAVQKVRYDMQKDFAPVSLVASIVHVLVVRKDLPVNNVKELVAYAKANPGKLSYGSLGVGTSVHLEMEMLKSLAQLFIVHIPYNSSPAQVTDLTAGRIDLLFNALGSLRPQIDAGAIKALAVTSAQRSPLAPQLPTLAESGVKGYNATLWLGLLAPAGTPADVGETINAIVARAVKEPDMVKQLVPQGMDGLALGPKAFGDFLKADLERWSATAKTAKIQID
jgi:tripartite-type tricarboxylate transporter receptor subunit TctC